MTNLMKMIFMMIRQMDAPRSGFLTIILTILSGI